MDPVAKQALLTQNLAQINRYTDIRWVAECGSTNTVLAREASDPTDPATTGGIILVTDRQTAGKGRLGRVWEAPVGASLAMSVRIPQHGLAIGLLPLVVGVATRNTVLRLGADPNQVELKWPNDLMNPETGRKFAGILCEAVGNYVIIGVGINLTRPDHLEGIAAERAQWVSEVTSGGTRVSQVDSATVLAIEIDRCVTALAENHQLALDEVRNVCATIGRLVRIEQQHEHWEGTTVGIDDGGALVVRRTDHQETVMVHAGDVVHLRSMP